MSLTMNTLEEEALGDDRWKGRGQLLNTGYKEDYTNLIINMSGVPNPEDMIIIAKEELAYVGVPVTQLNLRVRLNAFRKGGEDSMMKLTLEE